MDKKLSDIFPWNMNNTVSGQFILCIDRNHTCGEFTLSLLLHNLLLSGRKHVILLLFNHSKEHYESILQKQVQLVALAENIIYCRMWLGCALTSSK